MVKKVDLKKELKDFYNPSKSSVSIVEIPEMNFLMIDGEGDPNVSQYYRNAVESLFSVSYALKFMSKKGKLGIDYTVMPLESLWWVKPKEKFSLYNKDNWQWTAMIMQPEWVTKDMFEQAIVDVENKKGELAFDKLKFKKFNEGLSAQILYIGSYQDEDSVIQNIHNTIADNGGSISGKHHEIYLSDPRKTKPEKLKTILRQPFNKLC